MLKKILVILFVLSILPMGSFAYVPSDPLYNQQSYLNQIRVSNAWDIAKGKGVVVAVLDSGVDINHPELTVNIWQNPGELAGDGLDNDKNGFIDDVNGWDFVTNTADPSPKLNEDYSEGAISHGTGVSGLYDPVARVGSGEFVWCGAHRHGCGLQRRLQYRFHSYYPGELKPVSLK